GQSLMRQHVGVPPDFMQRLVLRHGVNAKEILKNVRSLSGLGELFGRGLNLLCEREIEYLIEHEWARSADDILWRRTKCGLHMDEDERERAKVFIDTKLKVLYP
ncbi:MAG: glycerol-3-phosphate dehydrogenase C-terminal domain-containing protein, partial [Pseudomonadota bacterium]